MPRESGLRADRANGRGVARPAASVRPDDARGSGVTDRHARRLQCTRCDAPGPSRRAACPQRVIHITLRDLTYPLGTGAAVERLAWQDAARRAPPDPGGIRAHRPRQGCGDLGRRLDADVGVRVLDCRVCLSASTPVCRVIHDSELRRQALGSVSAADRMGRDRSGPGRTGPDRTVTAAP
jgi:hypothetical protein